MTQTSTPPSPQTSTSKAWWSFALRELRGGIKGFRIFFACLLLGVAAIAGVGSLTRAIGLGLTEEGRSLLGGDVEVRNFRTDILDEQQAYLASQGPMSKKIRLRAMVRAESSDRRRLAEVKAVDQHYPLYGSLDTTPSLNFDAAYAMKDGRWGALIPASLTDTLRAQMGDTLIIGTEKFEVRGIIDKEPDQANEGFQMGPTVMISDAAMAKTGLVRDGSLVDFYYKIKLPAETDLTEWKETLKEKWPEERWRIRDRNNAASGFRQFIDRLGMFLTLVGLSALVVGGVGVGNAVRNYMDSKSGTIATFKVLGGTSDLIFKIYMTQIMILAALAITIGLVIGAVLPIYLAEILQEQLPVPTKIGIYPLPLIAAAFYGVLVTAAFSIWPLGKARDIPAARLFRNLIAPDGRWPRRRYIIMIAVAVILIALMAVLAADRPFMAAGFVVGAGAVLALLRLTGSMITKLAAKLPRPKRPGLRLALANIHRPGSATSAVVMSLGLGVTLFATITLVQTNMQERVNEQVPDIAPAFFFMDIQKYEADQFRNLALSEEGVSDLRLVPSIRARVVSVKGTPAQDYPTPNGGGWVLRGDRTVSYMDELPAQNDLVEGTWWDADYDGPGLVSFAADEARELGLKIGDQLEVNILGRTFDVTIANLRKFEWGQMNFNFVMIFSPNILRDAPHSYMASLKADEANEAAVHIALTDAFPGVTTIRVKELIDSVNDILGQIETSVEATALVAILAGILVLAGAIAAGHKHRVYDAVIMKIVGAVRRDILKAYLLEYLMLGLITGLVALALGGVAGYIIVTEVMNMAFTMNLTAMSITVGSSILITVTFGLIGTWSALGAKPMQVLRNQ